MKGGFYGVRSKKVSLVLIALVCTTILIWAWERTPLLTSFIPPQSRLWQFSPEILVGAPLASSISSEPNIHVHKDVSPVSEKDKLNEQEEQHVDVAAPIDVSTVSEKDKKLNEQEEQHVNVAVPIVPKKSSPELSNTSNSTTIAALEEEIFTNVTGEELKQKEFFVGETTKDVKQTGEFIVPKDSTNSSLVGTKDHKNVTTKKKKACNYAKGKWVSDDTRPLYSGSGCKQWLSSMWACRMTQRTDFAYEKLRWQAQDCNMENFKGTKFLARMKHKTLALIGDSLGRQQFQSLMCMVTEGKESLDVQNVGWEYGLVKARGSVRPDGWAYRFPSTNTTILYYWSASLCDLEPINKNDPSTEYAMHLDRPPAFLRQFLHRFDVLVLNTGHHWNRGKLSANRWVMHVGGVPNTNGKIADIGGAKNLTIHSIVKWVDSQLPKYPRLKAFYRTISPRHFFNGDWNTGGTCDNTSPLSKNLEVLQDESSDPVAARAVQGTKVTLLDITAPSQLRDEGHMSRYSIRGSPTVQDCLHWCLPGVPDTWNEMLYAQI